MLGTLAVLPAGLSAQRAPLVVRGLSFRGNRALDDLQLAAAIATTNSSWFARAPLTRWLGLGERRLLDEEEFRRDVLRLRLLYRQVGFPEAEVDTVVRRDRQGAWIEFRIREGAPIVLDSVRVTGLDGLSPSERRTVLLDLPLRAGRPFNRLLLQATVDTVVTRLRDRGFPAAEVFREFTSDPAARRAAVALDVITGDSARFGPVTVEAGGRVDTAYVRSLLTAATGDRFAQRQLYESQRNLYAVDLFRFATVAVDSARYQPGDSLVPLVARVTLAPSQRVRASVGYGTNDCFRGSAGYTVRNFLRTGNVLDLSGRVAKVGVGDPTDLGLASSICAPLQRDTIGSFLLNYNLTASVRRAGFLGPRNAVAVAVFSERRSEFAVYRREDIGASLQLSRDAARRVPVSLRYAFSFGRTEATPATFCAFFSVCTPEIIALQQERRALATLALSGLLARVNSPLDPTRGYQLSAEATYSGTIIGSAELQRFTRFLGEGALYATVGTGVVLSARLRGGAVFAPRNAQFGAAAFVPLEQRFYAGGPNDVRGFNRAELGPLVYSVRRQDADTIPLDSLPDRPDLVQVAATGGNTLAIGNVELRVPAPVLPARLRIALFADAGAVWNRGQGNLAGALRVTPGMGLRFATPIGPARFDIAYNRNRLSSGVLFVRELDGSLTQAAADFTVNRRRTLGNFQLHFAVGQPF